MVDESIWMSYYTSKDIDKRNTLIISNMTLAKNIALAFYRDHRSYNTSLDEIQSYAYMGLIDAVEKYDPTRGYVFSTYGSKRIYGAIIDYLRKEGRISRSKDEEGNPNYKLESFESNIEFATKVMDKSAEDFTYKMVINNYIFDILNSLIQELPKRERDIIIFHYIKGNSERATAKLININSTTVSTLKPQILEHLKRELKSRYGLSWKEIDLK